MSQCTISPAPSFNITESLAGSRERLDRRHNFFVDMLVMELIDQRKRLPDLFRSDGESRKDVPFRKNRHFQRQMRICAMRVIPAKISIDTGSARCKSHDTQARGTLLFQFSSRFKSIQDGSSRHHEVNKTIVLLAYLVERLVKKSRVYAASPRSVGAHRRLSPSLLTDDFL